MGKLEDFLLSAKPDTTAETEVAIAPFPFPFRVKAVTEGQNKAIRRSCETKVIDKKTRQPVTTLDKDKYVAALVVACTVEPNFKSAKLQEHYGVMGEEALIDAMLLPGQYMELQQAVMTACGFDTDFGELVEEAKN